MVKPTAHDGLDECSNHSGLNIIIINFDISPSAGIGRQSDLKIRWQLAVNVQVVFWILCFIIVKYICMIRLLNNIK